MKFKPYEVDFDCIWQADSTNPIHPPFKIIEDYGVSYINNKHNHYVKIIFLNKNMYGFYTTRHIDVNKILSRQPIRDYYIPNVPKNNPHCCLGDLLNKDRYGFNHPTYYRENIIYDYTLWNNLCKKVYYYKSIGYAHCGAIGVTLDYNWRCFQFFLETLPMVPGYGYWCINPTKYVLNYTMLQENIPLEQRVISLKTSMFISEREHAIYTNAHGIRD